MDSKSAKTVLVIVTGFLVVYITTDLKWALYIAIAISLAGSLSDFLSEKIAFIWLKLAWVLSLFMPKILLGVVFYFVLFPVAILSKLFTKKDFLFLRNIHSSTFINVEKKDMKISSFENPW